MTGRFRLQVFQSESMYNSLRLSASMRRRYLHSLFLRDLCCFQKNLLYCQNHKTCIFHFCLPSLQNTDYFPEHLQVSPLFLLLRQTQDLRLHPSLCLQESEAHLQNAQSYQLLRFPVQQCQYYRSKSQTYFRASDQILPELLFRPYYSESNFCKGLLFSDNRHILLCFRFHSEPYRENRPVYW